MKRYQVFERNSRSKHTAVSPEFNATRDAHKWTKENGHNYKNSLYTAYLDETDPIYAVGDVAEEKEEGE